MRFKFVFCFAALGAIVVTLPAWSHHSHGMYELETIDLEGLVRELHIINPHSWLYLEVTDDEGQTQMWALEAASGGQLGFAGVTADYIKPGDMVKARCHPLNDGGPGCLLGFVKAPDGSVKDWDVERGTEIPEDF